MQPILSHSQSLYSLSVLQRFGRYQHWFAARSGLQQCKLSSQRSIRFSVSSPLSSSSCYDTLEYHSFLLSWNAVTFSECTIWSAVSTRNSSITTAALEWWQSCSQDSNAASYRTDHANASGMSSQWSFVSRHAFF